MITSTVISQGVAETVLEGADSAYPELTERWTITNQAILDVPGLLVEKRDMLLMRMYAKRDAYLAAKQAVDELRID